MALTKIVTKKSVVLAQDKLYSIIFHLEVKEGTEIVINKDFSCKYRPGDNIVNKVVLIVEQMQKAVDTYKAELNIFTSTALDTAVTNISDNIIL